MREGLGGMHTTRAGAQMIHRCIGNLGDGVLAVCYGDGLRCLSLYHSLAYQIFFLIIFCVGFFS